MKLFKLFLITFSVATLVVGTGFTYFIYDHFKINDFELDQLTVLDKNGEKKTIGEIRNGKAILLNLSAAGCTGCEIEKPALVKLYNKSLELDDFMVLSISNSDLKHQKKFLDKKGHILEYAQLLDSAKLGKHPVPISLFFNAKGERVKQISIGNNWDSEEVLAYFIENK
ncbi:TlpA family protein disulfide reductase [Flammeovirga aprica]|uniref:Redoxin domain-containing protein n=1 Tax=Flammeovirga aprica JL-4 TaxID=694437 RepID=A0A7X9RYA7_9BACT|nr:redoxin domain-containing protein [Flammeovirga aprica]NME70882.1 redoxin domain-containing protein [Flammeovirga aprica JL-4]